MKNEKNVVDASKMVIGMSQLTVSKASEGTILFEVL